MFCLHKNIENNAVDIQELQNLRVCYLVHRGGLTAAPEPPAALVESTLAARQKNKSELKSFTRVPNGMVGLELLAHQAKFRNRWAVKGGAALKPSDYLDLEYTDEQMNVVKPSDADLRAGAILQSAGMVGPSRKMPQRRLNTYGEINNQCVIANDEGRIKRMKEALSLSTAISTHKDAMRKIKVRMWHDMLTSFFVLSRNF